MQNAWKRITAVLLCLTILVGFVLIVPTTQAEARNYGEYEDVAKVYDQGSCPSMQGMSVHGNYVYACKINGDTETSAVVARVRKDTGSTAFLTNAATGSIYFSDFGHGNDIEVETIAGVTTLLVPTSKSGSGALVRYKINGTTATKVGSYRFVSTSGSTIGGGALRVMHYDDTNITFLFKSGQYLCLGTLPISQTSGDIVLTSLCTLDYSSCYVNGTYKDTSDYSLQGMGYYDNKLYLPLSGHTVSGHENISIILVYDLEGAYGTIKPDPDLTFQITSSYYGAYFEVESCEISPLDNRMYFSTNRRRTSSDTNHDGVSYISNWTYDPSARTTETNNYRWEMRDNEWVSVTDGGNVFNGAHMLEGKITDGTFMDARFSLSKNVVLKHNKPWIIEWKSSGAWSGSLLLATQSHSAYTDQPYLFRDVSGNQISIGYYGDSQYNNYGVCLSDHGIDADAEHTYRLTNKLNADGSNMVYLSVDGKELGSMTTYFINGTKQSTSGTWVSGQDFKFSYMGTDSHKISGCDLEYLQIWATGLGSAPDEPNTCRWESGMRSVSGHGLNLNAATLVSGTTSGINYKDCRYNLAEEIVLMHDRPWVLEWDNAGTWEGGQLLASDHMSNTYLAPYLFRNSSIIAIGYHDGIRHAQWGVKLSSHGVDINAAHTYTLRNIISDDGSNMIWLYVDGEKIAPLTTYCSNGSATSSTSDHLAGKDFVFSYMGTFQNDVTGGMAYMQVWEGGKPEEDEANNYRWETKDNRMVSIVDGTFEENKIQSIKGSCADGVYTDTQLMFEKPITLRHDRYWSLQWEAEGNWTNGGLFLSSTYSSYTPNNLYIFRNVNVISFGQYTDGSHQQWGFRPSDYGIDHSQKHTYTLTNKINPDGTNMIYMSVDGQELGSMTTVSVNGAINGQTSDYLAGKDFVFNFLGTAEHPINDTSITYLQVFESCEHRYTSSKTESPTCTEPGLRTRTCGICGHTKTEVIPAVGHDYTMTSTPGDCESSAVYHFRCADCDDTYSLDAVTMSTTWLDYLPAGMDESLFHSKTQYRYSDFETITSYEAALDGYTFKSSAWEKASSGTVDYVNSWPSGFSTSSSLYSQYNKKSSKVSNSETATVKTGVDSDKVVGYLYYHWCYSGSTYSVATQQGSYTTFHAYYSTTAPSSYTCDTSDMSYKTSHSTCANSEWFFVADVYQQSYTQYKRLFTYECWTDFSDWADTAVDASEIRKVETRTVYQLKEVPIGSHSYNSTVIEPTCVTGGYTTYRCSACGDVYQGDNTPATGHIYQTVTIPPTCTDQGYTTYTCTICGSGYTGTYISAMGHSYIPVVTTPSCTMGGYTSYTCFECGDTYIGSQTAALGHSYGNGICTTCGAAGPYYNPGMTVPTLTLKAPTLEFKDTITVAVFYTAENIQDVVEMGMITYSTKVSSWSVDTAEYVIPGATYVESSGRYYSSSQGIDAKCLGDTVYLAIYAKLADGTYVYSKLASYSPVQYATNQLANSTDTSLKQLVAAMLNYGAEAQLYFGHNIGTLANSSMTIAQKALPADYDSSMVSSVPTVSATKQGIFANNQGFASRKPAISFEGAFCINYFFTPSYAPASGITLYYWNAEDCNANNVLTTANATGKIKLEGSGTGEYRGDIEGIAAKSISGAVYVAAAYKDINGTVWTSGVLGYSIGAYCSSQISKGGDIADLAKATAVYGYHAKQYFG